MRMKKITGLLISLLLLFQWLPASLSSAFAEGTWSLEDAGLSVEPLGESAGTEYNLVDIASMIGITIKVNGVDVTTAGMEFNRGDTLDLALRYELSNSGGGNNITGDDSIVYTLPDGLNIGDASGSLMDGGTIAGSYIVSGNKITFTYDQAYLDSMGSSNIIGTLNLTGTFEKDSIPDNNIGEYNFAGVGTITVHFAPAVLNGYKTADTSVLYAGGNTIEYQVQLTSDGTFNSTQVTDVLGSNLSYVPGSATINGSSIPDPSISGQTMAFSVGTVSYNEPLILKYTARVSDDALIYGASSGLVNNVTWQSGDETGSDSTTTWYTKDWMQKSSSWVDTDTGIIQWSITVNDGYPVDMTGMVLSDAFSAGQTLVGNISVSGSNGLITTLTPPSSASGFTYTVGSNGESGAQKLTITYQTQIDSDDLTSLGSHQYTNTIDATNPNWPGFSASDTSSITRSNSPDSVLSKAVTADIDNDSAEWTLNIAVPDSGDISQMVITDSMWDNYTWFDGGAVVVEYSDGTPIASDQYTVTYPNLDGDKRKTMNISFASTFVPTDSLVVRYKTDYDPAQIQNTTHIFTNNANLAYTYEGSTFNESASASWTLDTRQKMTKKAENFVYDSVLGVYTLQWTLTVNQDTDYDGLGETDFSGQTVSVVDTLQEGLTYLPDTLNVAYMKAWQPAGTGAASSSLSTDGSTITFELNPIDEHIVTITYKTSIDEDLLKVNGGATLENAAILLADGITVDDVTAQYTTQGDMVNKTAYQASGDAMIQYTVDVNTLHLDLDPASNTLTLSDVLAQDLLLVTGSITVTDIQTNTALPSSEYSVGYNSLTRQMTITVPDNRALRVKFSVILQGEIGETKMVSNTATLSNVFGASSDSGGSFIVNKVTGTVEAEKNSIRAIKVDSNSITTTLADAEFTLYKVNLASGIAELMSSQITLSVGTATFGSLLYDQLYYLVETEAPTGYVLASDPYYFIIPGDDGISAALDAQIHTYLPEGESYVARGGDVLFSNTETTGYTPTSTVLTVQKALTLGTLAANQFSFQLTETTSGATYTQTTSNQADGTVAFNAISYSAPGVYTYEITEVVPSGDSSYVYDTHTVTATVTVTDDGTGALQAAVTYSGDTTFTNTEATGYTPTSTALIVQKALTSGTLAANQFSFQLTETTSGATYTQTTSNQADGTVAFNAISYSAPGVYTYEITEVVPSGDSSYVYDTHTATATVTITDDGTGALQAAVAYSGDTTFTNTETTGYTPTSTVLTVQKALTSGTLAANQFSFQLTETTSGATYTQTTSNQADGTVAFNAISYSAPGVYTYEITEVVPSGDSSYVYDTHTATATVTVTDDGTGALQAAVAYSGDTTFTNTETTGYTPTSTALSVQKVLTSGTLAANQFSFQLTETTSGATYTQTTSNQADGTVAFNAISYSAPGVYTYEITEVVPSGDSSYVYDTHTATATVTITDDGTGALQAAVTYSGDTTFTNQPTHVSISKVAVTGGPELPNATLKVMDGTQVIETWVSGSTPHEIIATLTAGKTYTLVEETAPNGYTVAGSIDFTVSTDGSVDTVEMVDAPTHVSISKVTVTGGPELPNATLKVMDGNQVIETWVSGSTPHEIIATLTAGKTYTLVEETAPNGYTVAESIDFTVSTDGSVDTVEMVDAPTHVSISKVSVTGGPELPNATLKVMDGNQVIETWVSGSTPHEIIATLTAGKTYTLVEETAPNGYTVAESIDFTVSADGSVDTVEMVDAPTHVSISKVAVTGGPELPGATLKVMDGNQVIETWVSGNTPHEIIATLTAGKTYTLVEETAPNGYTVAESIDFTVSADGSVDTVEMVDAPTHVSISKVAVTGGPELPGATLKVMDGNQVIETWVSGNTPHKIIATLTAGKTYTLVEETAPNGYTVAESIEFTVSADGSVDSVEMVDAPTHVSISKKIKSTDVQLAGAELCIIDQYGKVVDTWYSETTPHVIQGLLIAGAQYTLKEIKAPSGYNIAVAITFSVELHAKNIEINMYDVLISSQLPETSDANQLYSWIALFAESGIVLLLVLLFGKLRKKRV